MTPTILLEAIEDVVAEYQGVINGEDAKLELLFDNAIKPEAARGGNRRRG